MGKKKHRQMQQAAYMRGYREATKDIAEDLEEVVSSIYNLRLLVQHSGILSIDTVEERLNALQSEVYDIIASKNISNKPNGRVTILDLQSGVNNSLIEADPMEAVTDDVVDYLIDKEFEDRDNYY